MITYHFELEIPQPRHLIITNIKYVFIDFKIFELINKIDEYKYKWISHITTMKDCRIL